MVGLDAGQRQAMVRTQAFSELVHFLNPTVFAQNLSLVGNHSYIKGLREYFHLLSIKIETQYYSIHYRTQN